MHRLPIVELLELIPEPNRTPALRLWQDERERFLRAPGSRAKHQAWPGGYVGHLEETMSLSLRLFDLLNEDGTLEFGRFDCLVVLYLHDVEKPWKYIPPSPDSVTHLGAEGEVALTGALIRSMLETKNGRKTFRELLVERYGFSLTEEQRNALEHVEGADSSYHPERRVMGRMAGLAHMCDVASAVVRHDRPFPA